MRIWKCTVCEKIGPWGPSWGYYGSLAIEEAFQSLLIVTCSEECAEAAQINLSVGKWALPVLRCRIEGSTLVKDQKGYNPQPDRDSLWEQWKREHKPQHANVEFIR